MAEPQAVGIDLGTTNSAVAWVDPSGRTAMIYNADGELLTPSVVLFDDAEIVVGKEALRAASAFPDRVAQWVKRDMGSPVYSRPIRGQYLPPEVIQSCILRRLRGDIVATAGTSTKTVITVPAYFDEPRRKATADAGEMAGLSLVDIVNEPTAAALAFAEAAGYLSPEGRLLREMVALVYDLGGGTFDATLLRLGPGDIRTLATDGDVQLGGHDWDARLVAYTAEEFRRIHGCDPRDDASALNRLYAAAIDAKHTLSVRMRAVIRVEHQGRVAEIPIAREQFEEMTADLLERTAYTIRQLVKAAGLDWKDVAQILLVGGSTRMPMVTRRLHELTEILPDRTVNPDEAVARGAAIYCKHMLALSGTAPTPPTFQVTNVNSHSLGIEGIDPQTMRKINVILIPRNTTLPAKCSEKFMTKTEGQRSIVIQVLEGESSSPGECTAIGRTVIRDLPEGLPKNWPVEVTFEYGSNGRLKVCGAVPGTHRETILELERDVGLSDEGISRWKHILGGVAGFAAFEGMLAEAFSSHAVARLPLPEAPALAPALDGRSGRWDSGPAAPAAIPPMPTSGGIPLNELPLMPPSPATSSPVPWPGTAEQAAAATSVPAIPMPGVATVPGGSTVPGASTRKTEDSKAPVSPPLPVFSPLPTGTTAQPAGAVDLRALGIEAATLRRRGRRWIVILLGYGTSAVLGLGLAYFVIRWLFPGSRLPLPW